MNRTSRLTILLLLGAALGCDSNSRAQKTSAKPGSSAAAESKALSTGRATEQPSAEQVAAGQSVPGQGDSLRGADSLLALRKAAASPHAPDPSLQRYLMGQQNEALWASFVLGRHCRSLEADAITKGLLGAVSLWVATPEPLNGELLNTAGWALGRCAASKFEEAFRPWLADESHAQMPELLPAAVLGLSTLVDRGTRLSERTQTLILDVAQREGRPELLLPLGRQGRLSDAVGAHLLEVAGAFLTGQHTEGRRQAIFALGSAGPSAAVPLRQVLLGSHYSVQERAAAAQALGQLGSPGQQELDQALSTLLIGGIPDRPNHPSWIPLITALTALEAPNLAKSALMQLQALGLPKGNEAKAVAQRRRLLWLRCRAADLIAGNADQNKHLLGCDPDQGRVFALAQLQVLSRGSITGSKLTTYQTHLKSEDPVVVQAALRLIPTHSEMGDSARILSEALLAQNNGTKTLAAQLIHAYPRCVTKEDDDQKRSDLDATLGKLIEDTSLPQETRAAAMQAAGALGALNLKSKVQSVCSGPDSLLWQPASAALALMGVHKADCPGGDAKIEEQLEPASEVGSTTVVIESDLGELRLTVDPSLAPRAAAHFLSLVDKGAYDHNRIIFGRYGFTVQFGDQNEDGYDDIPAPGLPFEVSPTPFSKFSLGMGSFAPGAENTQLFVTVSDAPQLFGTRIHLGHAEGPWELLVWGDELRSVGRLTK